ncbi:patched domain-containing protein 3-like [Centruroides vittatus]|uniref:patched domain-containing protein 3-like n=1 Tax=Centruroides vittatus TaxID=120091 RepID=UPI00350EFAE6
MKYNIVQRSLSAKFRKLGEIIGHYPYYFLTLPVLISAILSTGFLKITFNRDFEHLFETETGRASQNKRIVESLFPTITSKYIDILRATYTPPGIYITATANDDKNMIREIIFNDLKKIDEVVRNHRITWNDEIITYKNVCAIKENVCYENPVFNLNDKIRKYEEGKYRFRFPLEIDPFTLIFTAHAVNLGGVTRDKLGYVTDVKAIRLFYLIENRNDTKRKMASVWELSLTDVLRGMKFKHINISVMPSSIFASEMEHFSRSILPLSAVVALIVAIFSMITSISVTLVRSKPWLGAAGCVSAALAILATFGSIFHCGLSYTDIHIVLPFLILGTEIDDAYVLIAAWRRTNPKDDVPKRMADSFSEAAVSITITSLTNFLSFCIGITAPFPIVRLFCIYAAVAIFFTYIFQITFFGGCMAISGYREKYLLHPLTLRSITLPETKEKEDEEKEEILTTVFRDKVGKLLTYLPVKIAILIIFCGNLGVGIYGFLNMKSGMEVTDVIRAEQAGFINLYYRYFAQYPAMLQIVINDTLHYSDPAVQQRIEDTLSRFEKHPNIAETSSRLSWLKYYKNFTNKQVSSVFLRGFNMSSEDDFVYVMKNIYVKLYPARQFKQDVIFNNDSTRIVASRFLLLLKGLVDRETENKAIRELQEIADTSPIPITIHSLFFPLMEHGNLIKGIVIKVAWLSAILIILIFFMFIPNLICAICIAVAVFSSLCETIGYMVLWNVNLDMISMIVLIMSVGFSINYPTHISFAFMMSKKDKPNDKLQDSLYDVGLPIFQGTTSTILAVLLFAFESTRMFILFFKVMFLLSIQTAFHAMLVLPVVLSIVQSFRNKNVTNNKITHLPKYVPYTYDDTLYLKLMDKNQSGHKVNCDSPCTQL